MQANKWPVLLALVALFSACGGEQPQQDQLQVDNGQDSALVADRMKKTKNIFYNIPSPMETASLLKKAGADYNGKILNDVKNVDKYTAASKQALNLGIYGADLSYASVFNHTQESMFYTSCSKKLADRLGVSTAFNDSTLEAMERSQNDRDALLDIISETYWNVDGYLKENGRDNISALMIAGGWVEGLYIATQVAKTNDSPELRQRIAEQKYSLTDLIGLIASYEVDEPALNGVKADLEALSALYADVATATGGESTVTQEGGVTVVGGPAGAATLTDTQLSAIRDKAAAIRNTYIN
ncbi:MAG TPA: hypothetical protein PLN54_03460 [Flavobacteriales bacterium]|nr:hypothetical protein [Flavobacteriales bacterium]